MEKTLNFFWGFFSSDSSAHWVSGISLNFRENMSAFKTIASWWFQPIWNIWVKMGIFPKDRGENKEYFETTT